LLDVVLADAADRAGLATALLAEGVRVSRRGDLLLAVNYAPELRLAPAPDDAVFLVGGRELPPAGVSIWRPG
jgi:beta-galactosidase